MTKLREKSWAQNDQMAYIVSLLKFQQCFFLREFHNLQISLLPKHLNLFPDQIFITKSKTEYIELIPMADQDGV